MGGVDANAGDLRLASLKAASSYSAARSGYSFLVMQDGRVTYEAYANGDSPDRSPRSSAGPRDFGVSPPRLRSRMEFSISTNRFVRQLPSGDLIRKKQISA